MYRKVSTDQNFPEREKEVGRFWKDHDIFRKTEKAREGCPVLCMRECASMLCKGQPKDRCTNRTGASSSSASLRNQIPSIPQGLV